MLPTKQGKKIELRMQTLPDDPIAATPQYHSRNE